ncbi:hypothetical protein C9439_03890 [archaeon SCG-AAA382B04]|nr:hypothetical protein C9439_03890 [archaeon SCG-AAA382B04]
MKKKICQSFKMLETRTPLIKGACRDKKVLDIGCCGPENRLHEIIEDVSDSVIGIDNDIEKIKETPDEWDIRHLDAENFYLEEEFDVVVAGEVIEHPTNIGSFLDSARNHLRKDGKLIITTPNVQTPYRILRTLDGSLTGNMHIIGFTKRLLVNLLERKRWEVIDLRQLAPNQPLTLKDKIFNSILPEALQPKIYCEARIYSDQDS